ncbi:thioredoxin family protein [Rhodobacter capsulatus]|jgi:small redox-active disulfide protein 2|uniref:Thioredoxin family protein n=1 Tax=Rhodobacter capsulatus (strain ATCC BAA-309 / NBRC 16581 / SB1003) TaxID=272942 RepID=D5AVK3_RHOCB|nr:thioredoxin family protein [Rhodobacter capsulatus]ADE87338.1 thioredoxin family protein [Rhodobacter capsulatus SB 1003]ETD75550.1 glutaredoxin [Rhodobacter capsulatus B6]MDS0926906.1 thioredoxin family protein [Rhodobacter capsulatus]
MEIKVLGTGCAKCKATADLIAQVAAEAGKPVEIVKIEEMRQIVGYGVMTTPAVVVGEKVVHKGAVPSRDQVLVWLQEEA